MLLKTTLVIVTSFVVILLFAPLTIGLGRGWHSTSTDWSYGVFHWLIITHETVMDPATHEAERYRHVVINPRGAAWTFSAALFCSATIVWCWRRTGRLTTARR